MTSHAEAVSALSDAIERLESVGVAGSEPAASTGGVDLILTCDDGSRVSVAVQARAHLGDAEARRFVATLGDGEPGAMRVLVADELSADARRSLRQAGVGYFDRRGFLVLPLRGATLEASVAPQPRMRPRRSRPQLGSRGALTTALAHLMSPIEPPGVREVAERGGLAASTVSVARKQLRDLGLLGRDHRPALPDLFWEVAKAWGPEWHPVATRPDIGDRRFAAVVDLGLEGPYLTGPGRAVTALEDEGGGIALSGFVAAAAYGAGAVVTAETPPDLYVGDEAQARRAVQFLGAAPADTRAAAVAAAPTALVTRIRRPGGDRGFPLAHEMVVALDLAQDRGRGHEILESWQPWMGPA